MDAPDAWWSGLLRAMGQEWPDRVNIPPRPASDSPPIAGTDAEEVMPIDAVRCPWSQAAAVATAPLSLRT
jgi:hypothetical protein